MGQISISTKQLKKKARGILFKNYSSLMLSTLFFIALNVGFTYLSNCFASLLYGYTSDDAVILVSLSFMIISVIICVPLYFGYTFVITSACKSESFALSDLFVFYSSFERAKEAYACALKAVPELIVGIFLPVASFGIGTNLWKEISGYGISTDNYLKLAFGAAIFAVLALALAFTGFFLTGRALKRVIYTAAKKEQGVKISIWRFLLLRLTFIPLILLSLLSFGILFVVYTIPQILISYSLCLGVGEKEAEKIYGVSLDDNIPDVGQNSTFIPSFADAGEISKDNSGASFLQENSDTDTAVFDTTPDNEQQQGTDKC